MSTVEHVPLCRCRVLYLGSAIPIDTAVGIESIQGPCRDRFGNVDSDNRASGIDSVLSAYSSGLLLQYPGDQSTSTWFPIQNLHVCAAVKAVKGNGPLRFVSLDTPAAQHSNSPPMFACIMRRTKGIKVLECHVFICKSNQAAMALVQSCMHAFGHKEGWMDSCPVSSSRIVPDMGSRTGGGRNIGGSVRGGDLFLDRHDLVQKFDVSCRVGDNSGKIAPSNPPGAPVPVAGGQGYFADWNSCGGQPLMIIPGSPFYPGDVEMERYKRKKKKKKKAIDSSDSEEEISFVRKSQLFPGNDSCCYGNSGGGVCVKIKKGNKCCQDKKPEDQQPIIYAPQYVEAGCSAVATAGIAYELYDPEYYYCLGAEDQRQVQAAYDAGYYSAETEAYSAYYDEEGCYPEDYAAYPGYTDDYGGFSCNQYVPQPCAEAPQRGHFELTPYEDYSPQTGNRVTTSSGGGRPSQFVEVANGLGYYP